MSFYGQIRQSFHISEPTLSKQFKDMIQNKQTRQPITIGIMAKLKESIHSSKIPLRRKRLIWFTATTCLLGLFRIHEVLPKEQDSFDRSITLMQQDEPWCHDQGNNSEPKESERGQIETQGLSRHIRNSRTPKVAMRRKRLCQIRRQHRGDLTSKSARNNERRNGL